ncbi:MAG: hypothetical protein JXA42_17540 [Anaerolineales bacterium]|nr:hypothetical protein [Anaerolineales bacterium]
MNTTESSWILGAGMTGLAAGWASGLPIIEAANTAGGICSSYYRRSQGGEKIDHVQSDDAYRFEIGGGHWIFGGDPIVQYLLRSMVDIKQYTRRSSIYFANEQLYVPYPLQYHLGYLNREVAQQAFLEMSKPAYGSHTMKDWLAEYFGDTLCELFFFPFHDLYTAGNYERIAHQDPGKSPVDLSLVRQGAYEQTPLVGYNARFIYPVPGLDILARRLADRCTIRYGHGVTAIDVDQKELYFDDGTSIPYTSLISTLPLNKTIELSQLKIDATPDPYTSTLVLNIGAVRASSCPDDHWLYIPRSRSGFHRVGFYSNVDRSFLPAPARESGKRVSMYVERAYPGGQKPNQADIERYCTATVRELQLWRFIEDVDVLDPSWIDVAYTWSWPDSQWREEAIATLERHNIFPVGRFARWQFMGIAESIRDGLIAGSVFTKTHRPMRNSR